MHCFFFTSLLLPKIVPTPGNRRAALGLAGRRRFGRGDRVVQGTNRTRRSRSRVYDAPLIMLWVTSCSSLSGTLLTSNKVRGSKQFHSWVVWHSICLISCHPETQDF